MKVGVDEATGRSVRSTHATSPLLTRVAGLPWRKIIFGAALLVYVLLTLGVVLRSPLLTLDRDVIRLELRQRFPDWKTSINTFVVLGQRGPATLVALPWFAWRAWKSRSARPLVMLGTALVVLNLSVGVVKIATGRLGPRATHHVHAVFDGGDIYPSGHVSNAVVLYGLIAMLAVSYRRTVAVVAVVLSLTIGLSTVYLDTHWLSDVFGGWLAGALVLIVLPWITPYVERALAAVARGWRRVAGRLGRGKPATPQDRPSAIRHRRRSSVVHAAALPRSADRANEDTTPAKV